MNTSDTKQTESPAKWRKKRKGRGKEKGKKIGRIGEPRGSKGSEEGRPVASGDKGVMTPQ